MKKRILLSLLSFLILPIISPAQAFKQDSSLKDRNLEQQLFVMDYIKNQEPTNGFGSPDEVLSFMKQLENKWAQRNIDQSESYKRLNTYVTMWTVYRVFKSELPDDSECLIYSEIALPSFVKDVDFLKQQLEQEASNIEEAAYLIRTPNLVWAATESLAYTCNLDREHWNNLKEAIFNYPNIIQQYLDAEVLPDTETERYRNSYRKVLEIAKKAGQFVELREKIYQQEYAKAFAELAAEFPNSGDYRYLYVDIAKQLYLQYKNESQTELAFATLDLLARNTSEQRLSRNKLRSMYTDVDPREGPSRFESVNEKDSSYLEKSTQKQEISGNFFDAQKKKNVLLELPSDDLILLDFWSVSCGPCIDEIPNLNDVGKKYSEKVTVISINNDLLYGSNKEGIQEFVTNHNIQYPVILDTEKTNLMKQFDVGGWPARFLLTQEGYLLEEPIEERVKLSMNEIENYLKKL